MRGKSIDEIIDGDLIDERSVEVQSLTESTRRKSEPSELDSKSSVGVRDDMNEPLGDGGGRDVVNCVRERGLEARVNVSERLSAVGVSSSDEVYEETSVTDERGK